MAAPIQEYPPWLTPSLIIDTNEAGQPTATRTTIVYLPLTYLGPSIPLGEDYVFGGTTYPPTIVTGFPTTTTPATSDPVTTTTTTTDISSTLSSILSSDTSSLSSTATPTTSNDSTTPTTSSPTSSTTPTPSSTPMSSASRGRLVGAIVSGILILLFLFVILLAAWLYFKGRRRRHAWEAEVYDPNSRNPAGYAANGAGYYASSSWNTAEYAMLTDHEIVQSKEGAERLKLIGPEGKTDGRLVGADLDEKQEEEQGLIHGVGIDSSQGRPRGEGSPRQSGEEGDPLLRPSNLGQQQPQMQQFPQRRPVIDTSLAALGGGGGAAAAAAGAVALARNTSSSSSTPSGARSPVKRVPVPPLDPRDSEGSMPSGQTGSSSSPASRSAGQSLVELGAQQRGQTVAPGTQNSQSSQGSRGSGASSNVSSSRPSTTTDYGTLLDRPGGAGHVPFGFGNEYRASGTRLTSEEMRRLDANESVLPADDQGVLLGDDGDRWSGAYALSGDPVPGVNPDPEGIFGGGAVARAPTADIPPPRLVPRVERERGSVGSHPSLGDTEDAALLTARRVQLGQGASSSALSGDGSGLPRTASNGSGILAAIGLGNLSWLGGSSSAGGRSKRASGSGDERDAYSPKPARRTRASGSGSGSWSAVPTRDRDEEDVEGGGGRGLLFPHPPSHRGPPSQGSQGQGPIDSYTRPARPHLELQPPLQRGSLSGVRPSSQAMAFDSFGRLDPLNLGLTPTDGTRPNSHLSVTSTSGVSVYHDAASSLAGSGPGTPSGGAFGGASGGGGGVALPQRVLIHGREEPMRTPQPEYEEMAFFAQGSASQAQGQERGMTVDILDIPAPTALTRFGSAGSMRDFNPSTGSGMDTKDTQRTVDTAKTTGTDASQTTASSVGLSKYPVPPGLESLQPGRGGASALGLTTSPNLLHTTLRAKDSQEMTMTMTEASPVSVDGGASPAWAPSSLGFVRGTYEAYDDAYVDVGALGDYNDYDTLEDAPPGAQEGWRSLASARTVGGGAGGILGGGRGTGVSVSSGRPGSGISGFPQYTHATPFIPSEHGSLHSMRSHIGPTSLRSTGSAAASTINSGSFSSSSSRPSQPSSAQYPSSDYSGASHQGSSRSRQSAHSANRSRGSALDAISEHGVARMGSLVSDGQRRFDSVGVAAAAAARGGGGGGTRYQTPPPRPVTPADLGRAAFAQHKTLGSSTGMMDSVSPTTIRTAYSGSSGGMTAVPVRAQGEDLSVTVGEVDIGAVRRVSGRWEEGEEVLPLQGLGMGQAGQRDWTLHM